VFPVRYELNLDISSLGEIQSLKGYCSSKPKYDRVARPHRRCVRMGSTEHVTYLQALTDSMDEEFLEHSCSWGDRRAAARHNKRVPPFTNSKPVSLCLSSVIFSYEMWKPKNCVCASCFLCVPCKV
jgi:hypothetical protein